jgi:hypothetical protein
VKEGEGRLRTDSLNKSLLKEGEMQRSRMHLRDERSVS